MGYGVDTDFEVYKDGDLINIRYDAGMFVASYFALEFMGQDVYAVCVAMGIILTAILQIPCLIKRKT